MFVWLVADRMPLRALIDTGASQSLLRKDQLEAIARKTGRQPLVSPVESLVSMTEHQIDLLGSTEVQVEAIGPVAVTVVRSMRHDMILGWDQLARYGVTLDSRQSTMRWGPCDLNLEYPNNPDPWLAK